MSAQVMKLPLTLIKDADGALDPAWIAQVARTFGLRGFIETGTYLGRSLENVCGLFERAVSIELSDELHEAACRKFADRQNVTLLKGDSARRMGDARSLCAGLPTLHWLDAHWSAGNTARGEENTPILEELALIAGSASSNDVVLIDDIRYFISIPPGFTTHDANAGYPMITDVLAVLARFPDGGFQAVLLGDVLVCMSRQSAQRLQVSLAVQAITALRIEPGMASARRQVCEQSIAASRDAERDVLLALPEHYANSLQYGIGGEFCYWRGLVREAAQDHAGARSDFEMARRCRVDVPARAWEPQA
jgi:hypothetical protein